MKEKIWSKIKENEEKVFAKRRGNSKINENYSIISKRRNELEKEILKEIKKDLNLKERIIVHINKKIFLKVFNKTRIDTINKIIK